MSQAVKPYTSTEALRELSFQYITDAHQHAKHAEILLSEEGLFRSSQHNVGYLSKISVLLYMSVECSLKSLICASYLHEDPHTLYWKRIRPASHSFTKLKKEIPSFSSIVADAVLETELDRLSNADVSERYCFEVSAESDLVGDINVDPAKLNQQIDEVRQLLRTAQELRQKVWNFRQSAFSGQRTLPPQVVKQVLQQIKTK